MPAKTPIYLKTSTPKRGRKLRLRDVLSSDMISPPLGDFRHSAHIGPEGEGDMFGELSFLQGKYDLLPSLGRRLASQSTQAVGHEPAWGPSAGGYHSVLKSAVSVPVFSGAPSPEQAPPKPPRLHLEEVPGSQRSMSVSCGEGRFHSGQGLAFSSISHYEQLPSSISFSATSSEGSFPGPWGLGYGARVSADTQEPPYSPGASVPHSESLLGLDLDVDLGPSILDDVLRIMEEYKLPRAKAV
ncbi:cdc42 effector protein 2-like [Gopherus evgoodei]|uniref:cdc42 effector protein 2-like n=1 Tax=Gopherus evgoodei TaxID=1825980 RepID=UPI0011CFD0D6|nr:cdc42 effector protein 2-like [Gopherus evgoodei]XP_030402555.1 cdc42 effector protein 2-like [Gopherus evgoodei]XP_030402556.1 cdc42 effector protein 2-like [Gopherus evgoodei]